MSELYLPICFTAGINLSAFAFIRPAIAINNVFAIILMLIGAITPGYISYRMHHKWKPEVVSGDATILKEGGEIEEETPEMLARQAAAARASTPKAAKTGKTNLAKQAGLAPRAGSRTSKAKSMGNNQLLLIEAPQICADLE